MVRPEKVAIVEEILENLNKSTTAVLADYRGLTAAEMTELRKGLRDAGINFKIFKNTLATIAARQAGLDDLEGMLVGPTAIAFGFDDPIAVAKILNDFANKHDALEIKGGVIEHQVIDQEKVVALAKLPGREQLIAQFVGLLNQPIVRLVTVLNKPVQDLAFALNAVAQNKR
ncbi:MAG: 50S ribosomal protein L10 [Actinomycetota bacterium]